MKKSFILALIVNFVVLSLTFIPFKTEANITGGGLNVGAKVEVSKDGGATWYNYSADSSPGNQTLTAKPGDILTFRGKVWNEGVNTPANLTLSGIIDHTEYLEMTGAFYKDDEDLDDVHYSGTIGSNTITLPEIHYDSGNENFHYEGGTFQATLKNGIPDQTVITGIFRVESLNIVVYNKPGINLVPRAFAQLEGAAISTVRILVCNPPLPNTGADL
ncbi:MAG: hypothetical protein NT039_00395 [Candidatus Berkelbacteria bacterium]|nr:hypothetical protein [Candidatus Berkelbacteria bacterium]